MVNYKHRNDQIERHDPPLVEKRLVQSTENKNGILCSVTKVETVKLGKDLEGLICRDFSLQNIISSGSANLLKEMPLMSRGTLENADRIAAFAENFDTSSIQDSAPVTPQTSVPVTSEPSVPVTPEPSVPVTLEPTAPIV